MNMLLYWQVHGWGKTSPTACVWPRKKLKQVKGVNSTSSSCLLCASLSLGSEAARPPSEPRKAEAQAVSEVSLKKNQNTKTQGPFRGRGTTPREASRTCFPSYAPEGKKSLQIKEFIWCTEDWAIPGVRAAAAERASTVSDYLTSKAVLVLPPLTTSSQNRPTGPSSCSENFFWQSEEEAQSVNKEETEAGAQGLKTTDRKRDLRPSGLAGHRPLSGAWRIPIPLPAPGPGPGPGPVARSLLTDAEQCCLSWSLLPQRSSECPPYPSTLPYLATLQLLQKRGLQNYRDKLKARGLGAPRNPQKYAFPEARLEGGLPSSLLPALTVSRVVIPASVHRVL